MKRAKGLDIRVLRIFEAVTASGSLTAGARKLGITQSAVSQALSQIEATLGTQVFDRTHRPYKLTPAGIALSRRARQLVDEMDRLVIHVRDMDLASKPAIRVGMIDSFAATAGPAIVKRVTASASQLLLWSGLANSQAQALLNRQLDMIVTPDSLDDVDSIVRRPVFSEPFIIVVSKAREKELQHASLTELVQHAPLIRFSNRSNFGATIERYLRRCGHTPSPYLEIDTSDVVMAMAAADLGWTITTPLCVLQGRAYLPQVAMLPLPGPQLSRTIYQLSRAGEYEDMAEHCYQASRHVLENDIFPSILTHMPWTRDRLVLR